MVANYLQISDARGAPPDWILDMVSNVCLGLYTIEIIMRLLHFGCLFCHGPDNLWNFFDATVVLTGVVDQWLLPLLMNGHRLPREVKRLLPLLRGFGLLRIVKLFGMMMRSNLNWTESVWFQYVVSSSIILSIIIMGLETDIKSFVWGPIDTLILGFFCFELFVRVRRQGLPFFTDEGAIWNILDCLIVVFGVFDQWILNLWMSLVRGGSHSDELGDTLLLIRMLRLLRILRLLRLVKAVRPLYLLALGVLEAMQSMFWVLVLVFVTLYTGAILTTRIIGHGAMLYEPGRMPKEARALFENVPTSMFNLFVLMNGEEWRKVEPILSRYPGMKMLFVVFTIFSSWALLSVLTGVVSDNMISAKKTQNQKDEMVYGERTGRIARVLDDFFVAADPSSSGRISKDRYDMMLSMPFYLRKLQLAAPSASIRDLRDLFAWLETDGSGEVPKAEFFRGFQTLSEPLTGKAVLRLDGDIKRRFADIQDQLKSTNLCVISGRKQALDAHRAMLAALSTDQYLGHLRPRS